eukprot:Lankesteria_metandrocarpae@DN5062_c0_g1_i1.p1
MHKLLIIALSTTLALAVKHPVKRGPSVNIVLSSELSYEVTEVLHKFFSGVAVKMIERTTDDIKAERLASRRLMEQGRASRRLESKLEKAQERSREVNDLYYFAIRTSRGSSKVNYVQFRIKLLPDGNSAICRENPLNTFTVRYPNPFTVAGEHMSTKAYTRSMSRTAMAHTAMARTAKLSVDDDTPLTVYAPLYDASLLGPYIRRMRRLSDAKNSWSVLKPKAFLSDRVVLMEPEGCLLMAKWREYYEEQVPDVGDRPHVLVKVDAIPSAVRSYREQGYFRTPEEVTKEADSPSEFPFIPPHKNNKSIETFVRL